MATQASETWYPRCPRCGESKLILAPANGFTKHLLIAVEIYCPECQFRKKLSEAIKTVYVRM
jgi:rubredoxin